MDISSKYGWSRWITKDAEQRLPTQLTMLQKNALMNLINSESSTHGVENLNGADPTSESAKNLSFKGHRVIVIVKSENDKELIHENPKIVPLTPSEFYAAWDELLVDKKKFLQLTGYADDSIFNTTLMVKRFFNGK